ncbi:glycosyltransferase family 39 protein [Candidatus Poribacteria bacterium]|nr:glycosyltransferase family 39 protein [Candidatus Poribacteria bacterium]
MSRQRLIIACDPKKMGTRPARTRIWYNDDMSAHGTRLNARWKSRLLFFLVALASISAYLLLAPFNVADGIGQWLDGDYGKLTNDGLRILNGELLYRDIGTLYPPAMDYLVASVFRIFGDSILTLRITLALMGAGTLVLVFFMTRAMSSAWCALAATLIALLIGPVCLNYPYASWSCIPLGLCMVLAEYSGWKRNSAKCRLLAGMLAGTIFSFKPNWGIFALAALICSQSLGSLLAYDGSNRLTLGGRLSTFLVSGAGGLILGLSLVLMRKHLIASNLAAFILPTCLIALEGGILLRTCAMQGRAPAMSILPTLNSSVGFALVTIPWIAYFFFKLGANLFYQFLIYPSTVFAKGFFVPLPAPSPEAIVLVFLSCFQGIMMLKGRAPFSARATFLGIFGLFGFALLCRLVPLVREGILTTKSGEYDKWGFAFACYVPLAVHAGMGCVLARDILNIETVDRSRTYLSLCLWIYSIAAFHVFYPLMDIYHLIWPLAPVVALGATFLFRSLEFWKTKTPDGFAERRQKTVRCLSVLIVPLFMGLFFGLPIFKYFVKAGKTPFQVTINGFSPIRSRRGGILMPERRADDINNVVDFVQSSTSPGKTIFDMTGSLFYFLADRHNPIRWAYLQPDFFSPEEIEDVRRTIESLRPRLVVTSSVAEWNISANYPVLYSFIYAKYKPLRTFGEYQVLSLRNTNSLSGGERTDGREN